MIAASCSRQRAAESSPPSDRRGEDTVMSVHAPILTYEQLEGKDLFGAYCAVCHGSGGAADGFNTFNLDPKPHDLTDSTYVAGLNDDALKQVIRLGGIGVNKSNLMPAYRWTLSENQIEYLVS
jgi:mono/diheme cytochrome c family protein